MEERREKRDEEGRERRGGCVLSDQCCYREQQKTLMGGVSGYYGHNL